MEGTSKQHGDMTDQTKRYTFMSSDNQLHTGHTSNAISSCQNSGGYTDTLTYKKSVRIPHLILLYYTTSYLLQIIVRQNTKNTTKKYIYYFT